MATPKAPPILQALSSNPEYFLKPAAQLHADTLATTKYFLDPVAFSISQEQQAGKKRKRAGSKQPAQPLRLQEVHVDSFTPQQVWEQAQRVLRSCDAVVGRDADTVEATATTKPQAVDDVVDGVEGSSDDDEEQSLSQDGSDVEMPNEEFEQSENDGENHSVVPSDVGSAVGDESEEENETDQPQKVSHPDHFGLNDGFFSIDDFNKQSALFEQQDSRNPADNEDDDEEVDWHADPFGEGASNQGLDDDDDDDEEGLEDDVGEDIDGGDLDVDDLEIEDDEGPGEDESEDPRNIRYSEFFDPPALNTPKPKKRTKQEKKPALKQTDDDADDEVNRAIADVRRDLFEDESDGGEDDSDAQSDDGGVNLKGLSTHEQRRVKLADEMRKLEAANVAKKDWTMSGEARGADRPENAVLEEDLEFERVGKPVPVITADITHDIEAQIKQRIIAKEFDDIRRRHAIAVQGQGRAKAGRFELDDSKPQQSLAELYEADHLRATDPGYSTAKDKKLKKEHDEIKQLWDRVSSQLDTLSNWHYKPKTPAPSINVVQDVDTIMMEDVRPSAAGGTGASTMLAPQEVYAPGEDGTNRGEVLLQSGATVSKDEMSREAKSRRRRREKQKRKKAGQLPPKREGPAAERQEVASDLKKGGVRVIGKEGRLTDVQGRDAQLSAGKERRSTLKL